jgi:hypothetical protein
MRCNACGFRKCIRHEREWHINENCTQYDKRVANFERVEAEREAVKKSLQVIFDSTKMCPGRGCGWNIEKNKGCDHMTCKFHPFLRYEIWIQADCLW